MNKGVPTYLAGVHGDMDGVNKRKKPAHPFAPSGLDGRVPGAIPTASGSLVLQDGAFQPQTDGLSWAYGPNNWLRWLPWAELQHILPQKFFCQGKTR
jgi:hypothetical protein